MPRCAEPECDLAASWTEGFRKMLCDEHFLERFKADLEALTPLLAAEVMRQAVEIPPTWSPKWLRFNAQTARPGRKTRIWDVVAIRGDEHLGVVDWETGWRKYAFFADLGTVYEEDCLRDIARFCEEQTQAHKFAAGRR